MSEKSVIRTIYLYLFATIGLVLIVIGSVNFINMGLKATIFKQADIEESLRMGEIYPPPLEVERIKKAANEDGELTAEERATLKTFIKEYEQRQAKLGKIDYLAAKRQRDASINLSLLLVGMPLYLYHWRIVKRENKNSRQPESA